MGRAYTKEDIIGAALMRFESLGTEYVEKLRPLNEKLYNERGKDEFRKYASVTPEVMREYFKRKI